LLLGFRQAQPHRQPDQPFRQRRRQRQLAMRPPEALARGRRMQRDVMKYRLDRIALEFAQYRLTIDK
jgi:hypothetical protein